MTAPQVLLLWFGGSICFCLGWTMHGVLAQRDHDAVRAELDKAYEANRQLRENTRRGNAPSVN